jgi:hypothetical protein
MEEDDIINENYENYEKEKNQSTINIIDNIYKVSKGTLKIELENGKTGSGFFLKCKRNNKPFYCIMTNNHVITCDLIKDKKKVIIKYESELKELSFYLNKKERIIICFEESTDLDVTVLEIIPKDKIDESYFLEPNTKQYEQIKNKNLQIVQYPGGNELSYSNGKISGIYEKNKNMFLHDSGTFHGSSGSPIVLKGEEKVFAIHKGKLKKDNKNVAIFIKKIIDKIENYKKNGKGREYYKNGKIKYEGKFLDDKYEDMEAKFYYENGDLYIGEFKEGIMNGNGIIYSTKFEGKFSNGEYSKGKLYYDNGDYYIGSFKNGKKEGKGKEYYKNNRLKYKGKFVDDKYEDDEGKFYYENGEVYTGQFKNGKIFGKGCKTDNNGKKIKEVNDGPDSEFDILKRNIVLNFLPFGGIFNINCNRCNHPSKNHIKLSGEVLQCKECPESDNICMGRNYYLKK